MTRPERPRNEAIRQAIAVALAENPDATARLHEGREEALLTCDIDPNEPIFVWGEDPHRACTAFEWACDAEHEPLALALMDHGFDWRLCQLAKTTAFDPVFAAARFSRRLLERLHAQGAPLEEFDPPSRHKISALHIAARAACAPALRFLLENGVNASAVSPHAAHGQCTALHELAVGVNAQHPDAPECARVLAEFGADLAALDELCQTPLHLAYLNGADALAEELLRLGSPWLTDALGNTPQDAAQTQCNGSREGDIAWPHDFPLRRGEPAPFEESAAQDVLNRLRALPARVERDALLSAAPFSGSPSRIGPSRL